MQAHINLGRVFGVQIGLHISWLIIALLITLSLASYFTATNPGWSSATVWVTAVVTGILFFTALILHELSHALVARSRGLPIRRITLFALGGVAQMERESADASTEFWMGIAGPIASAVIGFVCLGLAWAFGWRPDVVATSPPIAVLVWLGYINLALAAFNMIPGFPLDGGRVLRALLWWRSGDARRATRTAAQVGQVVAWGFIVIGLLRMFTGAGFAGLWLAFIGWFLLEAARASYAQVAAMEELRDVKVADVMGRDCTSIDGHLPLRSFVDDYLMRTGQRCYLVVDHERLVGIITPTEIKQIDPDRWRELEVDDAMRPLEQLSTVTPDTPAAEAFELMSQKDVNQLPVIADGHVEGVVSRGHLLRLLQSRAELHM